MLFVQLLSSDDNADFLSKWYLADDKKYYQECQEFKISIFGTETSEINYCKYLFFSSWKLTQCLLN